jgi:carbon-monoxide dehydrogenase small subunit
MAEPTHDVVLRVNGAARRLSVPARRLLSDALRHDLRLTGTHVGCEHGVCGCCTVLLDGEPVRSCLTFAVSVDGRDVTTVEGLSPDDDDRLHPIQRAFQECHGLQCGFCTPGFIMSTAGLLADDPDPDDEQILEGLSGNLCRCTGYRNILRSVRRAAELLADDRGDGTPADPVEPGGSAARADAGPPPSTRPEPQQAQPTPYAPPGDATPATSDGRGDVAPDDGEGRRS